jgi:hypothetical protein
VSQRDPHEAPEEFEKTTGSPGFFERRVSLRWVLGGAALLLVIMAAILVTVFLVDRHDDARREAALAVTSSTDVTSPYDFSELPADSRLDIVEDAAFVSIFLPNDEGGTVSYGISSELPSAQALAEAIAGADEVDPDALATTTGTLLDPAADVASISTITFVFADRTTLTFALDLDQGLVAREGQAWQPDGDLHALVEAAIAEGQ